MMDIKTKQNYCTFSVKGIRPLCIANKYLRSAGTYEAKTVKKK